MADFPFLIVLQSVLLANGTGTMSYTVPNGESLEISSLVFQSTGTFAVTDIRNSASLHYTNASASIPIPSAVLPSSANNFNSIGEFISNIKLGGGDIIYFDVKDTSGAGNTVNIVLSAVRSNSAQ